MITRYGTKKLLRGSIFVLIFAVVIGYALFATHDFILGPNLTLIEPANGSSFTTPSVHIKGVVQRIQEITLNDRPMTIDAKGNFNEVVLLSPGYNVFQFFIKDKFGRSRHYRLEYTYTVN